jgi:hypothetical protein
MKEIKSWADVTIGQYQEIMSIQTTNKISKFIESLSILLDCDPQVIRDMNMSQYNKLVAESQFLSKQPESIIEKIIEVDGKRYGLIPDMTLIEAGVFIDAEQFKEDSIENLHLLTALVYRPIIKHDDDEYEIEKHKAEGFEKRANLFKEKISVEAVMGAVLFFSLVEMRLLEGLATSFLQEVQATQI